MASFRGGLAAVLSLLLPTAACATVKGSFQRAPRVTGPVDLSVETGSGDVTVKSGPPGQVSIIGRITASSSWFGGTREEDVRELEKNPPLRQDGNKIELVRPRHMNVSIDYEITVPADTRLRADTGSGTHRVTGLRRGVAVVSGSGDIRLDDVGGGANVETGSGDVNADKLAGAVDARTGSGHIEVRMSGPGDVKATTGSGGAEIVGVDGGLFVDTGSGDVTVQGTPRAAWSINTSSGDVSVRVPAAFGLEVDLSTSSGDISVGRPVQTVVQGQVSGDRDHVAGRVGAGGSMVKVSTGSGDVSLD